VDWDAFICHAHEDKAFVGSLAQALRAAGLRIWYDDFELKAGDSLRRSIDRGLARSRFGVVVLSRSFFSKSWTQYELDGLVQRDLDRKVILPIWHQIERGDLIKLAPSLADKVAIRSTSGIPSIVSAIVEAIDNEGNSHLPQDAPLESSVKLEKPRMNLLRDLPMTSQERDDV